MPTHQREKQIYLVLISQLVSQFGNALTGFLFGIWIFKKSNLVANLGLMYFFQLAPGLILAPYMGTIVDKFSRKKIVLITELLLFISLIFIYYLFCINHLSIHVLYTYVGLCSVLNAAQSLALTCFLTTKLENPFRIKVNTLISLRKILPRLFAPLIAGVFIDRSYIAPIIVIDILSYVVSFFTLLMLNEIDFDKSKEKIIIKHAIRYSISNIKYIYNNLALRYSLLFLIMSMISTSILGVYVLPIILTSGNSFTLAFVTACGGVGAFLGSNLGFLKRKESYFFRNFLPLSIILQGFIMSLSCFLTSNLWICFLFFSFFLFVPLQHGQSYTLWQNSLSAKEYGRFFSLKGTLLQVVNLIVFATVGILADYFDKISCLLNAQRLCDYILQFHADKKVGAMLLIISLTGVVNMFVGFRKVLKITTFLPGAESKAEVSLN